MGRPGYGPQDPGSSRCSCGEAAQNARQPGSERFPKTCVSGQGYPRAAGKENTQVMGVHSVHFSQPETLQANLIMPEPCPFLNRSFPLCSIIRPTEAEGIAMGGGQRPHQRWTAHRPGFRVFPAFEGLGFGCGPSQTRNQRIIAKRVFEKNHRPGSSPSWPPFFSPWE